LRNERVIVCIEGIAQDSAKCETKVISENGKPSLITFNENQLINRFSKVFKEQLELKANSTFYFKI
jgi:hypothetical protein